MEKKSLVSKKNAPASKSNSIHSRCVDLSKPAPARVETCRKAGGGHEPVPPLLRSRQNARQ
jgi:hypothetical protein